MSPSPHHIKATRRATKRGMTLGVHFAITGAQADALLDAEDDGDLADLVEEIEEAGESSYETDKAWDAIHRCLSNGTLEITEGEPPLNRVILGGRLLNEESTDYVVVVMPEEVQEIADALRKVTEDWLRDRYETLPFPDYQGEKSDEDWAYTWESFQGLVPFFAEAARDERHVIFTVSQ